MVSRQTADEMTKRINYLQVDGLVYAHKVIEIIDAFVGEEETDMVLDTLREVSVQVDWLVNHLGSGRDK